MCLVVFSDFFFPGVVQFFFADAENFFYSSVQRGAVGAPEFFPNIRDGFVAVMLYNVEHERKTLCVRSKFGKERVVRKFVHVGERHEAIVERCRAEEHVAVRIPGVKTHAR